MYTLNRHAAASLSLSPRSLFPRSLFPRSSRARSRSRSSASSRKIGSRSRHSPSPRRVVPDRRYRATHDGYVRIDIRIQGIGVATGDLSSYYIPKSLFPTEERNRRVDALLAHRVKEGLRFSQHIADCFAYGRYVTRRLGREQVNVVKMDDSSEKNFIMYMDDGGNMILDRRAFWHARMNPFIIEDAIELVVAYDRTASKQYQEHEETLFTRQGHVNAQLFEGGGKPLYHVMLPYGTERNRFMASEEGGYVEAGKIVEKFREKVEKESNKHIEKLVPWRDFFQTLRTQLNARPVVLAREAAYHICVANSIYVLDDFEERSGMSIPRTYSRTWSYPTLSISFLRIWDRRNLIRMQCVWLRRLRRANTIGS